MARSTSAAALDRLEAQGLRDRVLDHLRACGWFGATGLEVAEALDLRVDTAVPRIAELYHRGLVVDRGAKRRNASTGCLAVVWFAAEAGEAPITPVTRRVARQRALEAQVAYLRAALAAYADTGAWERGEVDASVAQEALHAVQEAQVP